MTAHGSSNKQQHGGRGEANYFQVGLQGRKTGVVLEDFINQDEDGFDDIDKVFETARPTTPPTTQLTKPKLNSPELTHQPGSPMHLVSPGSSISLTDVYKSRELDSPQRRQLATDRKETKLVAKALLRQREESITGLSGTDQGLIPPPSPSPPQEFSPDPLWSQAPSPPPTTRKKTHPTKGQKKPQSTFTLPNNGRHHPDTPSVNNHSPLLSNPASPQRKPKLPMAKRTGPPPRKPHLARRTGERAIPRAPSPDPFTTTTSKDSNLPLPLYDIHDLVASASVLNPHRASKEPSPKSPSSTRSSPPPLPPVTSRAKKKKITRTKVPNPSKKLTQKTNKSVPKLTTKKKSNRVTGEQVTPSIEEQEGEEESTSASRKTDPTHSDNPSSRNPTKKTNGRKGSSQRKPEKGEMIVDTYIVATQEEPNNEEEGEETGLRRSKRARYGRLKFWKNEKVDYEWVETPQGPVQQLKVKRLPDASPARTKRVPSTTTKRPSPSSTRDHAARYHAAVARSTAPTTPTLTDPIAVYPDPGPDLFHPTWGTPSSGPGYELVIHPTVAYLDLHAHATYLPSFPFTTLVPLYGTVRATLPFHSDPHLLAPGTTLHLTLPSSLTLYNPSSSPTRLLFLSPHQV